MTASSWLRQAERHSPGSPIQEPLRSSFCSLAAAAAISQGWSSPGATLLLHLVVPANAIVAALGSEQIDHPTRRQPGRGGPQGPPVRFEVVNAGSIADAARLLIEALPESASVQDARPSSRRRMAAANVRTGARSVGSYGRGEHCSCCRWSWPEANRCGEHAHTSSRSMAFRELFTALYLTLSFLTVVSG